MVFIKEFVMYAKEGLEKKTARHRAAARRMFCLQAATLSPREYLGNNNERQIVMRTDEERLLRQAARYYRKQHQRREHLDR